MSENNHPPQFEAQQTSPVDVKNVVKLAWTMLKQNQIPLVLATIVTLVILVTLVMTILTFFNVTDPQAIPPNVQMIADILVTIVLAPLAAGMAMMGVKAARQQACSVRSLFDYLPRAAWLALTSLFISVIVQVGLLLFILPGIYLMIACSFALMLVADRRMSPVAAVVLSIKTVNKQWSAFVLLYLVFGAAFIASALTFGIGFIWSIPFYYNALGVLYHQLFDTSVAQQTGDEPSHQDTVFDA
ncbi:hypothetical protein [Aestuariibacter salexigens]|uniref:hypothetical protein n=1 Tax=Aestuariibacter salexigens TaxID=226010 RepID=UPI000428F34C|nr:hypothetical protein [Aestuariibacter salexigens]